MDRSLEDIKSFTKLNGKVEYTEFTLNNGLEVILSKDSSIPSVAINLCYHVGSKDEDPDKRGFAHLFEHLMFEGSEHIPVGEYDKICLKAGGENNAYTTEDKTNYFVLLPSNHLETGLWLESDRMLGFTVSQHSFDKQRDVVMEEKKQVYDNRPYGSTSLEFMPRLFQDCGYAWDTIGDMNDLAAATLDDAKAFYERFYVPNNAVLTVVGDIDIDKTKVVIDKYFGTIANGTVSIAKNSNIKMPAGEIVETIYDNIQFPGMFIAYRIPSEKKEHFFELDLLSDILASGDSSRLYNELVYEKQLCSDIGCYVDPKEFAGIFYIYAILMPDVTLDEVEREIDRIIEEMIAGKIREQELQKVKNRIETRFTFRKQSLLSKADHLAHYKMFFREPELINTYIGNYSNVTIGTIRDAASKYLQKANRVVLKYLPKSVN